jgi:hypothetical protein
VRESRNTTGMAISQQITEYCESDMLNTYRVLLRYELFCGRVSDAEFQASEANLIEFVKVRGNIKPHPAVFCK